MLKRHSRFGPGPAVFSMTMKALTGSSDSNSEARAASLESVSVSNSTKTYSV